MRREKPWGHCWLHVTLSPTTKSSENYFFALDEEDTASSKSNTDVLQYFKSGTEMEILNYFSYSKNYIHEIQQWCCLVCLWTGLSAWADLCWLRGRTGWKLIDHKIQPLLQIFWSIIKPWFGEWATQVFLANQTQVMPFKRVFFFDAGRHVMVLGRPLICGISYLY